MMGDGVVQCERGDNDRVLHLGNVVSQHIERASLGECSLMGLFNKKKL